MALMEQRMNNMDTKADALAQSDHKLKNYLDDQSRLILEIDKAQKAQQAEFEAWKRLPKLPAPGAALKRTNPSQNSKDQ
jgi:hypothetical protein